MSKLVLFDIDGTLTTRVGDLRQSLWRFPYAVEKLFGVKLNLTVDEYMSFNGWIDKAQVWEMVKAHGVSRKVYERRFPQFGEYVLEYMNLHNPVYHSTRGAKEILSKLITQDNICLGVITGNVEQVAWWKLERTGLRKFFNFGLFGGEANNRLELAEMVFEKARKHFHRVFSPSQITVIGDTVHDVYCAKHIGAKVILLLTGGIHSEVPRDRKADLVARALTDTSVRDFLGI